MKKQPHGEVGRDEEIARRRDEALLRALNTPPKPHSAMKLGKRKAKAGAKPRVLSGAGKSKQGSK